MDWLPPDYPWGNVLPNVSMLKLWLGIQPLAVCTLNETISVVSSDLVGNISYGWNFKLVYWSLGFGQGMFSLLMEFRITHTSTNNLSPNYFHISQQLGKSTHICFLPFVSHFDNFYYVIYLSDYYIAYFFSHIVLLITYTCLPFIRSNQRSFLTSVWRFSSLSKTFLITFYKVILRIECFS